MTVMPDMADMARSESDAISGRDWAKLLSRYQLSDNRRAIFEILVTAAPLAALWTAIWYALEAGYWFGLILVIPAAGFLVRLFMIQHDCSHGSFFSTRLANDWTGRIFSVLTLTPYDVWQHTHALHHAGSGCLDHRGFGDVDTLTVSEYRALSGRGRFAYRLYRNPLIMFGIGPIYLFFLQHRLPIGLMRHGWRPWISAMATNFAVILAAVAASYFFGLQSVLMIYIPTTIIAATIGVWLFFVQHQFEYTSWDEKTGWNRHDAALNGSSHYDLPGVLRWFSANIGVHHVHHLCSRIPYYRLRKVLRDYPDLEMQGRLTLLKSFGCVRLVLWDDAKRRLISFREAKMAAA